MKLDFSSPKKGEATAALPTVATTTSPSTAALATPINAEEKITLTQSPGVNVIVQTTTSEGSGNGQSLASSSGNSQPQKGPMKINNKKLKGNSRRNRIVTFDEHQLNQSGSFSSIPIKDLLVLAQQQVSSFKSPKKSMPSCSLSPQPSSPPESFPQSQPRQISNVTAVTIPNDVSGVCATPTTTAGVSSLHQQQQQEVGGAGCINSNNTGLLATVTYTTTNTSTVVANVATSPAAMSTCVAMATTTPATTSTNPTRCCTGLYKICFVTITILLVLIKRLKLHHHPLFKLGRLKLSSSDLSQSLTRLAICCTGFLSGGEGWLCSPP